MIFIYKKVSLKFTLVEVSVAAHSRHVLLSRALCVSFFSMLINTLKCMYSSSSSFCSEELVRTSDSDPDLGILVF